MFEKCKFCKTKKKLIFVEEKCGCSNSGTGYYICGDCINGKKEKTISG